MCQTLAYCTSKGIRFCKGSPVLVMVFKIHHQIVRAELDFRFFREDEPTSLAKCRVVASIEDCPEFLPSRKPHVSRHYGETKFVDDVKRI